MKLKKNEENSFWPTVMKLVLIDVKPVRKVQGKQTQVCIITSTLPNAEFHNVKFLAVQTESWDSLIGPNKGVHRTAEMI